MTSPGMIRLPAIEVRQTPGRRLYSFAVDGKTIPTFAAVARLHRRDDVHLAGYQRPEVLNHITGIRAYLESEDPLLPNAVVIAFDKRVKFVPSAPRRKRELACAGELSIPTDPRWDDFEKPGWVVDGQQRIAAIREASIPAFPICVTAFITNNDAEQRMQFILVNSTKPLPKGLVYELLPATEGALPKHLRARRLSARLLERLNHDLDSPLHHMIKTPTAPDGMIKDNSILKMLDNSLSDGALYHFRDPSTLSEDLDGMLVLLKRFWEAARWVFTSAFGTSPRKSRLMHGVGIISMGFLMDAMSEGFLPDRLPTTEEFAVELDRLRPICHWTSGSWTLAGSERRWNDLQNIPKDIQLLADHLLAEYRAMIPRDNANIHLVVS